MILVVISLRFCDHSGWTLGWTWCDHSRRSLGLKLDNRGFFNHLLHLILPNWVRNLVNRFLGDLRPLWNLLLLYRLCLQSPRKNLGFAGLFSPLVACHFCIFVIQKFACLRNQLLGVMQRVWASGWCLEAVSSHPSRYNNHFFRLGLHWYTLAANMLDLQFIIVSVKFALLRRCLTSLNSIELA